MILYKIYTHCSKVWGQKKKSYINNFIQQECNKLIKIVSKDIVTNLYFILLNFLFSQKMKNASQFLQKNKQHNCIQHW